MIEQMSVRDFAVCILLPILNQSATVLSPKINRLVTDILVNSCYTIAKEQKRRSNMAKKPKKSPGKPKSKKRPAKPKKTDQ
jgi:hypothetical protein